jgi:hypothetical protein
MKKIYCEVNGEGRGEKMAGEREVIYVKGQCAFTRSRGKGRRTLVEGYPYYGYCILLSELIDAQSLTTIRIGVLQEPKKGYNCMRLPAVSHVLKPVRRTHERCPSFLKWHVERHPGVLEERAGASREYY